MHPKIIKFDYTLSYIYIIKPRINPIFMTIKMNLNLLKNNINIINEGFVKKILICYQF